ncbi:hypothetical protein KC19_4G254000 [Ceratodon purpureus]|uniref:Uncharacterized protein n=1 Tax=Ceratodon purpureus TaxID=3225 RepID=A0A8T0ICI5_CERPU|nr:hypothetical protein KC19_4G254000 [Ceratodon purpureus]
MLSSAEGPGSIASVAVQGGWSVIDPSTGVVWCGEGVWWRSVGVISRQWGDFHVQEWLGFGGRALVVVVVVVVVVLARFQGAMAGFLDCGETAYAYGREEGAGGSRWEGRFEGRAGPGLERQHYWR